MDCKKNKTDESDCLIEIKNATSWLLVEVGKGLTQNEAIAERASLKARNFHGAPCERHKPKGKTWTDRSRVRARCIFTAVGSS